MLGESVQYQVFSPENNDFQKKSKKQFFYGIKHVCFLFNLFHVYILSPYFSVLISRI